MCAENPNCTPISVSNNILVALSGLSQLYCPHRCFLAIFRESNLNADWKLSFLQKTTTTCAALACVPQFWAACRVRTKEGRQHSMRRTACHTRTACDYCPCLASSVLASSSLASTLCAGKVEWCWLSATVHNTAIVLTQGLAEGRDSHG